MKNVLSLVLAMVMCASPVFGQGSIGIFSDAAGTNCSISAPTFAPVYFWHHQILAPGATLAQFKVCLGGGVVAAELGGFTPAPGALSLGTTLAGIQVAYGACRQANFYLGSQFYSFTATPACSRLDVVGDPASASGEIETRDCTPAANVVMPYQNGYGLTINPNVHCQLLPGCLPLVTAYKAPVCIPLATSDKSWGQIKALYR